MINAAAISAYLDVTRTLYQGAGVCLYVSPYLELRKYISNYTMTFPKNAPEITKDYTIMPHGSGTLVMAVENGEFNIELCGPAILPDVVGGSAMKKDLLVIVEFQPAGLFALFGIPQHELTEKAFPLAEIDSIFAKQCRNIVEACVTVQSLINGLDQLFYQRFTYALKPEVQLAIYETIKQSGVLKIGTLSSQLHYSERQLQRLFDQQLGASPKLFSRIVRINKTMRLLRNSRKTIDTIAGLAGYYDPAHFVKDFKAVTGRSPQEFRDKMSDFYNEMNKF